MSARGQRLRGGRRADELLVEAGLAVDQQEAASLILAGQVLVGSERIEKAGQQLPKESELRVRGRRRFVSRGGFKLERALSHFAVDPAGRVCLDAGASTGGFTDCLLQHAAARVYAVDVGYGQLAWELRSDERVVVLERTNVRGLDRAALDPLPDLVVADLSFLSLAKIIGPLMALAGPGGEVLALVKPQFEVARKDLDGGVVRDAEAREEAVRTVIDAVGALGFWASEAVESPLKGADGNVEYLVHLRAEARQ